MGLPVLLLLVGLGLRLLGLARRALRELVVLLLRALRVLRDVRLLLPTVRKTT